MSPEHASPRAEAETKAGFQVAFRRVDVVFGDDTARALELLDQGKSREEIIDATGAVVGVAGADIEIEPGEICVLMGLSGSGKSTLLRCLNRLNRVSRGEVLVRDDGEIIDVARCDARTLRRLRTRRIAMVFQQFALLPWRTVRENVGFGLELRGTADEKRRKVVDEKLEMVGLAGWGDKYAHELSGGMQQRVGLARAFATDADILLMDEPFSALDPLIRTRLQDELLDLQQRLQKTIVFVSHDLDEAMKIGSHIAIMEGGRIVQYGAPEEIILSPASGYVRDFVANMNPLNVLTGASLMTPLDAITCRDGSLVLDPDGEIVVEIDSADRPQSAHICGHPAELVAFHPEIDLTTLGPGVAVLAERDITLRTALEIHHHTRRPLVLVDDGRVIGMIGANEIYKGILGRAGAPG
jgi:glycine betaine/proline transport system ATP-binding protein